MTHPLISALRLLSIIFVLSLFAGQAIATDMKYRRTIENYSVPDVVLVNQNGAKVHLKSFLASKKPVIVDFIFVTGTITSPLLSAGYANLQQKLGPDSQKVQLVSISIDSDNDLPKVMNAYLKRHKAKAGWDFLTGSRSDIDKVMRAFNAYVPNKASQYPLTLIRPNDGGKWIRVFGLMSGSEFMEEIKTAGIK